MLGDTRATTLGFLGAILVLGTLIWLVGVRAVLDALAGANTGILVLVLLAAALWLTAWGVSLWAVLAAMDEPMPITTAVLIFSGAIFANNITPFGQAGGEPLSALLISDAADTEYETGLAAIASVDTIHFVPTIIYATVGLLFVAVGTVRLGRNLVFGAAAIAVLAVAIPVVVYLGWRNRGRVEAAIARGLVAVTTPVARALPNRTPPTYEATKHRVDGFFVSIERIATNRRALALAIGFSALGWLAQITALWLSLYAIGQTVPFAAVLLVVPIGAMAGVTPLPGGSGAVESVLAAMLVATTSIPLAVATSAALIHRGAIYWLPTVVGGIVATLMGAERAA